ncbi:Clavaminate synthase-like protein [Penicillium taxi]|uniref:Clavaminate synthase-like protein n=1 Tax=Penicillium taxi TaxID=168475 RepID=UPI002545A9A6|nr:Clavaminate synthase-like protein [Penicillium taxi]KAJ5893243.1 Clavaminate synthase-like protein [Penicillium taxi]
MATQDFFREFSFPGQQDTAGFGLPSVASFPLGLHPREENSQASLADHIQAIETISKSGDFFKLVQQHGGAVLIRGLPIKTAQDYSQIAHAFGFSAHDEVGRPPLRTVLALNIKTANEGPPEMPIWPHNEYGWSTVNPAWLTFSALVTPESGGETPITSSIKLAASVKQQAPEFFNTLLEKGVRYVYRYGADDVRSSNTGASVLSAYGAEVLPGDDAETVKQKVEHEVRRHSNRFEWHEDGSLSVTHVVPIIRIHTDTGLTTWFGNLTSAYGRSKHHGATEPPFLGNDGAHHPLPTYGDGSRIPTEYLELALKLAESSQVSLSWQPGDVVLLDVGVIPHNQFDLDDTDKFTESCRDAFTFALGGYEDSLGCTLGPGW